MGEVVDTRRLSDTDLPLAVVESVRGEFLDHIAHLPDALLANIYAPDRHIIWSTNPDLIGHQSEANGNLDEAFSSKERVGSTYFDISVDDHQEEQQFIQYPHTFFIENYIPLLDLNGDVAIVVEIYKEPNDLVARIKRGIWLIVLTAILGAATLYIGLFWIVRRASLMLAYQQQKLIENEAYVVMGEMSSAVAHSLRNPLATIRSSAELALELDQEPARKNINDIISQVDRMSAWVRDLLQTSNPMSSQVRPVELVAVIDEALSACQLQLRTFGIEVDFAPLERPMLLAHRVLLSQVLNSVLSNAIEAMPHGGVLRLRMDTGTSAGKLMLSISDTGNGMSHKQRTMAFKPFFTTKQGGLGVGLVTVKRIMERFGGEVSLNSYEHRGTTINLWFSLAQGS
jgi:two-component system sensor histidine kinase HydH